MKTQEGISKSDVTHIIYGEIKIGDRIKWKGEYFSGYTKDGKGMFFNKKQDGINKVKKIFKEGNLVVMELDNKKHFFIKNLRNPKKNCDDSWSKIF